MANLNKVMLIGRLTNNAEVSTFSWGRIANFTIAVNNRRKNNDTGQWEEEPSFIDAKMFGRGQDGKNIDIFTQYIHKGNQVFVEGSLRQERWENNEGQKRSKLVLYVDNFQILESPRGEGGGGDHQDDYGVENIPSRSSSSKSDEPTYSGGTGNDDDIPF